jgi:CheY-like chemotaxis protein
MDLRAMLRILLNVTATALRKRATVRRQWAMRQRLPDVVLLDILMPVMDGAAACATFKRCRMATVCRC